jgi:hypothetical protein
VLNLQTFRRWRLAALRWSVVASLPAWIQTQRPLIPEGLLFLGWLGQGARLILTVRFAVVEHVWAMRLEQRRSSEAPRRRRQRQLFPVGGAGGRH